jgi:hypothetical protein
VTAAASASLVEEVLKAQHRIDVIAIDEASPSRSKVDSALSGFVYWTDATAVLALARHADAVVHRVPVGTLPRGLAEWSAQLPGIALVGPTSGDLGLGASRTVSDGSVEELAAFAAEGDPDVGRRAIALSFGPTLARWGMATGNALLDRLDRALEIFD